MHFFLSTFSLECDANPESKHHNQLLNAMNIARAHPRTAAPSAAPPGLPRPPALPAYRENSAPSLVLPVFELGKDDLPVKVYSGDGNWVFEQRGFRTEPLASTRELGRTRRKQWSQSSEAGEGEA